MSACPGNCNGPHRRDPENVPAVPGLPVWCGDCANRVRNALNALPRLYAQLELDKRRGTRDTGTERLTGGGANHPSPSAAVDDQDTIVRLLAYWEDALRETFDMPWRRARLGAGLRRWPVSWCREVIGPARCGETVAHAVFTITHEERIAGAPTVEAATVEGASRFIRRHLDVALAHEGHAVELGRDLMRAAERLRRVTKSGVQRRRMPLPCPRCELKALVHEGGTEHVRCGNPQCGRILSRDEYDDMAAELAKSKPTHHRKASA